MDIMGMPDKPMTNEDYQAHDDAHVLARAHDVKKEPARHRKAIEAAKSIAESKMREAKDMAKATKGMGEPRKTSDKPWPNTSSAITGKR
jgi:biotin synthase-like enzyme